MNPKQSYYDKRGPILVKNLQSRHFDAWYYPTREEALKKALELIPEGAIVGWGGSVTANQIGLMEAVKSGPYNALDRDKAETREQGIALMKQALLADVFISSANALSLDGQMVNIDGNGNRVAALVYGPESVIIVAGMNKVEDTLEAAITRARTIAAPMNKQRFPGNNTPCAVNATCADCKSEACICNHVLVTRHCRPAGRIKFILIGEELGF